MKTCIAIDREPEGFRARKRKLVSHAAKRSVQRSCMAAAAPGCCFIVMSLLFARVYRAKRRKMGLAAGVPLYFPCY